MIIDCDLHQGNGSAHIFRTSSNVFTFFIHQQNNYPAIKPPSNLDIGLVDGADDQQYLSALKGDLPKAIENFKPEIIFYIAGADPYFLDRLGGLKLTLEGLSRREMLVCSLVRKAAAKFVVVFGGGYAQEVNDTVKIHYSTVKKVREMFN